MTRILKWSGDGLAAGALVAGSSAGSGDTAPTGLTGSGHTIVAAGTRSPSILLTQVGAAACAAYWTFSSRTSLYERVYFRLVSPINTTTNHVIHRIGAGSARGLDFSVIGTGRLRFLNAANVTATGMETPVGTLAADTDYRLELALTTNVLTANIYLGEATSPLWALGTYTGAANEFGSSFDRVTLGNPNTTPTSEPSRWDDLALDDSSQPGPYVSTTSRPTDLFHAAAA